jgi:hypothetical protein
MDDENSVPGQPMTELLAHYCFLWKKIDTRDFIRLTKCEKSILLLLARNKYAETFQCILDISFLEGSYNH